MAPFEDSARIAEGTVGIDLDTAAAHASMDRFKSEFRASMAEIGRQSATVDIKANIAAADIKIKEFRAELARLEAKKIGLKTDSTAFKETTEKIEGIKKKLLLATAKDYEFKIKVVEDRSVKENEANKLKGIRDREKAFEDLARKESQLERDLYRQQTDRFGARKEELRLQSEAKAQLEDIAKKEKLRGEQNFVGKYKVPKEVRQTLDLNTDIARAKLEEIRFQARLKGIEVPLRIDEKGLFKAKIFGKGSTNVFLDSVKDFVSGAYGFTKKGPDVLPFVGKLRLGAATTLGTVGLPILSSLLGVAGGLGAGATGAAAVGGGLALGGGLNLAGLLGVLPQVSEELKTVTSAQQKWHKSLIDTGAGSEKTQKALAEYKEALSNVDPPLRKAVTTVTALQEEWHKASKPIVNDIARVVEASSKGIKPLIPTLAKNSGATANKLAFHTEDFFGKLDANKGQIDSLGKSFNLFFGKALIGAEDFAIGLLHIGESAARLFAGPFGGWLEKLGRDFEHATEPGDHLDKTVKTLGDDAKLVGEFFGALGKVILDLFQTSAPSGLKTIQGLTGALDKWDEKLKSVEGKKNAGKFFEEAAKSFRELGPILSNIVHILGEFSVGLVPLGGLFLRGIVVPLSEVLKEFAELAGFKNPLRVVGEAIVLAYGAHRFAPAVKATQAILNNIRETGSVSRGFGKFFQEKGAGAQGATFGDVANARMLKGAELNGEAMAEAFILQVREAGLVPAGLPGGIGPGGKKTTYYANSAGQVVNEGRAIEEGLVTGRSPGSKGILPSGVERGAVSGVGSLERGAERAAIPAAEGLAGALEAAGLAIPVLGSIAATVGIIAAPSILKAIKPGEKYNDEGHREAKEKGLNEERREKVKAINKQEEEQLKRFENKPGKYNNATGYVEPSKLTPKEEHERKSIREGFALQKGTIAGGQEVETLKSEGANPPLQVLEKRTKDALRNLPDLGKQAALQLVTQYTEGLEKNGHLPRGSTQKLIESIRGEFKDLGPIGSNGAKKLSEDFKRTMDHEHLSNSIGHQTDEIKKHWYGQWGLLNISTHAGWSEITKGTATDLNILKEQIHNSTGAQRKELEVEYAHLQHSALGFIGNTKKGVEAEIGFLTTNMKTLGPKGPAALEHAYKRMAEVLIAEAENTGKNTGVEFSKMNAKVKKELQEIGPVGVVGATGAGGTPKGAGGPVSSGPAAQGYVQFGKAGERGGDNIHTHLRVGAGETGAVFNHHQQAVANQLLSPVGGLKGLFHNVNQPHHQAPVHGPSKAFAQGGLTGGSHLARIESAADEVNSYDFPYVYGGGHENPAHLEAFDCSGAVSYVVQHGGYKKPTTVAQDIGSWGLPGGKGAVSIYYRPVRGGREAHTFMEIGGRFFGTGWNSKGGAGWASAPPSSDYLKEFNVVHLPNLGAAGGFAGGLVKKIKAAKFPNPPAGKYNAIGQKATNAFAAAGNAKLAQAAESVFNSSGGGPGGNVQEGQAAGSAQEKAWAKAGLIAAGLKGSPEEVALIVYTMSHESGGNPHSENTTDSNARAGHPSRGLMELIPENFAKYHVSGTSNNVFDPVANVAAAVRYMIARYHHIVGMSPYAKGGIIDMAKGGLYNKPALLVGEHDNEFVINPSRPDNANYLKAAGESMGYHVTPASKGKPGAVKRATKLNSKEEQSLPFLREAGEHGGVPVKVLQGLLTEIKSAVGTEQTKLASLEKSLKSTKAGREIAKKLTAHGEQSAIGKYIERSTAQAQKAALTLSKAKETAGRLQHAAAVGGPGDQSKQIAAAHAQTAVGQAQKADAIAKHTLKTAHDRALADLRFKAGVKDKKEAKRIANLEFGIAAINKGGVYEKEKYIPLKQLKREENEAKAGVTRAKGFENNIKRLNKAVDAETHHLNILAQNWAHTKDPATKARDTAEWNSVFGERKGNISKLNELITQSKAEGAKLLHDHGPLLTEATKGSIRGAISEAESVTEGIEDKEAAAEGESAPGTEAAAGPPSAEQYVEQLGKLPLLEVLEEKYALAQTAVKPDNANTVPNEELPGLEGEKEPTQALMDFWKGILDTAKSDPRPKVVTEIANAFTSAQSTALGLVNTIESAKKGQASQGLQEAQQFGQARLELYKQFGSNFSPVLGLPAPRPAAVSTALPSSAGGPAAPASTTVHITNNFKETPANPHHFAQGTKFELQAAL